MTRPIMKDGLWALSRPSSIGAFAQTASNPCPALGSKLRDNDFVQLNGGGDA
jgi:hypothetical protein